MVVTGSVVSRCVVVGERVAGRCVVVVTGDGGIGTKFAGRQNSTHESSTRFFLMNEYPDATDDEQNVLVLLAYMAPNTALFAAINGCSKPHSFHSTHSSLTAKS